MLTAIFEWVRPFWRVAQSGRRSLLFRLGAAGLMAGARDAVGPDSWRRDAVSLNGARCFASGDTLEVITNAKSGGYSALLPLVRPEYPDEPIRFRCGIEVIEGSIGVAAVTANCTMLAERVAHRPGQYQLDIVVPQARDAAAILVRNYSMTGWPSRVRFFSLAAEVCLGEQLPRLASPGANRILTLPLRSCGDRERAREIGDAITTWVDLNTATTAAIVVDAWDNLGEYVAVNIAERLAPTLAALRTSGMRIIHLTHDHSFHPLAQPMAGETVVPGEFMDTDFIADMFCNAGVKHLLYMGYHSNQCVLRRSLGLLEMHKRGFDTILVRDASAARESVESLDGEWFHRAAVHFVELNGSRTVTSAEIQAAVAAARCS